MDIKELTKELCKKHCHHLCHDTKDCVVEDEAREYLHSALTNEGKVSAKDKLLLINENKSNNFDVKSNNLPFVLTNEENVSVKGREIEEMANILKDYTKKNHIMASSVILEDYAEALYNAGYRKQSEGEWIKDTRYVRGDGEIYDHCCSKCNAPACKDEWENCTVLTPYCPNCGAKMKGGEE